MTYGETITIDRNLKLVGAGDGDGAGATILHGSGPSRVVTIAAGITATLQNLRVTGAQVDGGIRNDGTLTLSGCFVSGNTTTGNGGGIISNGTLTLGASNVTVNHAALEGGGIYNAEGTVDCGDGNTVSGNTAGDAAVASNCIDISPGSGCETCLA